MRLQIRIGSFIRLSVVGEQSDCHAIQRRPGAQHLFSYLYANHQVLMVQNFKMSAIATKRDGKIGFMNDENKVFRVEKCTFHEKITGRKCIFHSKNDSIMTFFIAKMTFSMTERRYFKT